MNINITTEPGTVKAHRAILQTEDGTQGVFAESDNILTAIGQIVQSATTDTQVAVYAGIDRKATWVLDCKALIQRAMQNDQVVEVLYQSSESAAPKTLTLTPLFEIEDGVSFRARLDGVISLRTFRYSRVHSVKVVGNAE